MTAENAGILGGLVAYARQRPGTVLAWILGFHLIFWTLAPMAVSSNLQLDLAEDLALGREWQLGYWKHPPLPWWIADLAYRVTGHINAVYLLGPLAAVICLYVVWLLAREIVGDLKALIAVIALEGIHFYNFSVVKFAHDQMQLPLWAFTGLFLWRGIVRGRLLDWMLAGAFLAGAFWTKYSVFVFAVTLGLVLLLDPFARRSLRTAGPYVMVGVFAIIVAPNVWWLVSHDFLPFQYVDSRAVGATRWYQYLLFPLQWTAGQLVTVSLALGLLALLYLPRAPKQEPQTPNARAAFDRRYLTALAIGPFAITTLIAAVLGRSPVAMWAYPFWTFLPLAILAWAPPALEPLRLRRFAAAAIVVLMAFPVAYVAAEIGEPLVRDRAKATQFPGRLLAETLTERWRERTGQPLVYVGGALLTVERDGKRYELTGAGEFAANNVAIYSPDRPRVVVKGQLKLSPWIDAADVERRGVLLVWQPIGEGLPESLKQAFPRAELQPPLTLPRQTVLSGPKRSPVVLRYAIVMPQP